MNKRWQFILVSALLMTSIFSVVSCSGKTVAKDGDTVKVDYTLTLEDGTVADTSIGKEPFEFTLGENAVIPGFETAVEGMEAGETKTVIIPPEEGYGLYSDNLIKEVNRTELPAGMVPVVGQMITVNGTDGSVGQYPIIAVTDSTITIDFNPPLAGKTLTFEITLLEIVPKN